jgi:hypothetical protein
MLLINNKIILFFLMLVLIIASGQPMAKMYKWVDKDGNTQYSQHPPPNDPAVEIEKNYQPNGNIEKTQLEREQKREEFNKRHQDRLDKDKQAKKDKKDKKKLQLACNKARSKLKNLMMDRQVRKKVGDTYTMMTDDQRKKDIARLKKKIKEQCK